MNGTKWRHWKEGRVYIVLFVALHSETREELVIYKREGDDGQVWARPLSMWVDEARPGVRRFVSIEEQPTAPPPRCYTCGAPASTRAWVPSRLPNARERVAHACSSCVGDHETTLPVGTLSEARE